VKAFLNNIKERLHVRNDVKLTGYDKTPNLDKESTDFDKSKCGVA